MSLHSSHDFRHFDEIFSCVGVHKLRYQCPKNVIFDHFLRFWDIDISACVPPMHLKNTSKLNLPCMFPKGVH